MTIRRCPTCGLEATDDARFCPADGTSFVSDEPEPRPLRCALGFHRWTVWSRELEGSRSIFLGKWEPCVIQQRECLGCHTTEVRSVD